MTRKRTVLYTCALALLAGCTADSVPSSHSRTVLTAFVPETKTVLQGTDVLWCSGDRIAVNSLVSDALVLDSPAPNATFSIEGLLSNPLESLYPASFYKDASTITLPGTQAYMAGTFASGTVPMAAYTTEGLNLAFKHLGCIVKLTLRKGPDAHDIKYVELRGNAGEQLSGDFSIDYAGCSLSTITSKDEDKAIRLEVNSPQSSSLDLYICVPARTFSEGFTIKVCDTAGHYMTKSKTSAVSLEAGHIHPMAAFDFVPTGTELSSGIEDVYTDLTEKSGYPFMGIVSSGGMPLEGVAVSDGVNVTKTNEYGQYWLQRPAAETDFILLSTPGGYVTTRSGILPMNWAVPDKDATEVQRFDFELTPADQSRYHLLVFADMHLSARNPSAEAFSTSGLGLDFDQFRVYKDYINTIAASLDAPVYGVNLGDMTQKQYWDKGGDFPDYLAAFTAGFPVYSVIGNHDHDHTQDSDYAAAERYRSYLGPTYYSFNIGTQHYVAIDNMQFYVDAEGKHNTDYYTVVLDSQQLSWLEKDLAAAPESTTDYVLLTHCPIRQISSTGEGAGTKTTSSYVMRDAASVIALFGETKKLTILSGHSHVMSSFRFASSRISQYVHTSVCGSWWYSPLCHDGTPASMHHYTFAGDSFDRELLPLATGYRDRRYRVYSEGITTRSGYICPKDDGYPAAKTAEDDRSTYPAAVNLDLYEWQPSWTVKVWENGVEGVCYPVDRVDFDYRDLCDNGTEPYEKYSWLSAVRSLHNIQYQPSALGSSVTFKVYDDSGSLKYSIDNIIVK